MIQEKRRYSDFLHKKIPAHPFSSLYQISCTYLRYMYISILLLILVNYLNLFVQYSTISLHLLNCKKVINWTRLQTKGNSKNNFQNGNIRRKQYLHLKFLDLIFFLFERRVMGRSLL